MKLDEALELLIETVIKKKDGWYVISEKTGRNLGGPYPDEKKAKKRLQQIHFFMHFKHPHK